MKSEFCKVGWGDDSDSHWISVRFVSVWIAPHTTVGSDCQCCRSQWPESPIGGAEQYNILEQTEAAGPFKPSSCTCITASAAVCHNDMKSPEDTTQNWMTPPFQHQHATTTCSMGRWCGPVGTSQLDTWQSAGKIRFDKESDWTDSPAVWIVGFLS